MAAEDPTFNVQFDEYTKEIRIGGQGSLHLEYIRDTLQHKYNIESDLGDISINYKETITETVTKELEHIDVLNQQQLKLTIKIIPSQNEFGFNDSGLNILFSKEAYNVKNKILENFKENEKEKIQIESLMQHQLNDSEFSKMFVSILEDNIKTGYMFNYPTFGYDLSIECGNQSPQQCSESTLRRLVGDLIKQTQLEAVPVAVEPSVRIKMVLDNKYLTSILNLIDKKRIEVVDVESIESNSQVECISGLSQMQKFTLDVRSLTQGNIELEMSPDGQIQKIEDWIDFT